ncbi:MAG: YicC/YloC family endoribonuclease [Bermanella sp.]
MILSMTAFARADHEGLAGIFYWEIRSVNSRYLELHFRLPDSLKSIEGDLRDTIRAKLTRGKVECNLKYIANTGQQELTINEALVSQLNQAADQVHALIGPGNALDALEILKWPGVLSQPELDMGQVKTDALQGFDSALTDLVKMREREGSALKVFIEQRMTGIDEEVSKVKAILPQILQAQRESLLKRLRDVQIKVDEERFEQEMVILLQKTDVDEELDRLQAHLEEVGRILKQGGAIGRRLDFMMQELNREANTLSSKSISHLTTQIAVQLKVLIEQMREQIQNIE